VSNCADVGEGGMGVRSNPVDDRLNSIASEFVAAETAPALHEESDLEEEGEDEFDESYTGFVDREQGALLQIIRVSACLIEFRKI